MNPPAEQLVRDYLNRLSLAARSRLGLSDRQALLDQTRARIEAEVGSLSRATPAQVRQTLAALGDPIALVENERTKIAARKEAAIGSRIGGLANGAVRQVWPHGTGAAHASVRAAAGAEPTFDLQVPGRLPVTSGISAPALVTFSEVPAAPGTASAAVPPAGSGSPAATALPVPAGSPVAVRSPVPPVSSSVSIGLPPPGGPPLPGVTAPATPSLPGDTAPPPISLQAPASEPGHRHAPDASDLPERNGVPPRTLLPRPSPSPESLAGAPLPAPNPPDRSEEPDRPDEPEPGVEFSIPADESAGRAGGSGRLAGMSSIAADRISRLGSGLLALALRDRLETIAIVLLAIGAAVYPPIWLIGALVAISSKKWDRRDKWLGLAVPVLLVIFGAVLLMALGGQRPSVGSYAFEAWLAAGRLSRIAAVLGAGYLLRRVYQGKREPRRPPWSTPRKPG